MEFQLRGKAASARSFLVSVRCWVPSSERSERVAGNEKLLLHAKPCVRVPEAHGESSTRCNKDENSDIVLPLRG